MVEAATTIHVTAGANPAPIHVAVLRLGGQRVFAKLDHEAHVEDAPEEVLAGQKVKLLIKDDGDHYFQIDRGRSLNLGRLVDRVRGRIRPAPAASEAEEVSK